MIIIWLCQVIIYEIEKEVQLIKSLLCNWLVLYCFNCSIHHFIIGINSSLYLYDGYTTINSWRLQEFLIKCMRTSVLFGIFWEFWVFSHFTSKIIYHLLTNAYTNSIHLNCKCAIFLYLWYLKEVRKHRITRYSVFQIVRKFLRNLLREIKSCTQICISNDFDFDEIFYVDTKCLNCSHKLCS